MSILKRLILGNLIIFLSITIWGGAVTYKLNRLNDKTKEIVEINGSCLIIGDRLTDTFGSWEKFIQKYYITGDIAYYTRIQEVETFLEDDLREINRLVDNSDESDQVSEMMILYMQLRKEFEENSNIIKNKGPIEGLKNHGEQFDQMLIKLKEIITQNKKTINENIDLVNLRSKEIFKMTITITFVTILFGGIISIINTRVITDSISIFKKKTKEISQGHYKELTTQTGPREIRDLSRHFNAMSRRLTELDNLKGDFISHVSHELRTPITAIKEASIMLSKDFYSDQPSKLYELYGLINEECDRLLKSVVRLLDYSKMEAKEMDYTFSDFDLSYAIRKSILKLAPLAQKKNISLEFIPPPQLPILTADDDRIQEILDNLLGNALKFTSQNGEIIIKCSKDIMEKKIIVSVMDNGCGIKPEYLKAIFEKFKQIDNGIGTRMGTGLGLSISKHIIKAHGGDIWAESNYKKGTQFFFTLPLA